MVITIKKEANEDLVSRNLLWLPDAVGYTIVANIWGDTTGVSLLAALLLMVA